MSEEFDFLELLAQNRPRPHHYTFAPHALRGMTFHLRDQMRQMLISGHATAFLKDLWDYVAQDLGEDEVLPSTGLLVHNEMLGEESTLSIVVLPEPRCTTEAHMIGIAFLPSQQFSPDPGACDIRYFTLEKGFSEDDIPRTTLCEWHHSEDGVSHLNFGDGPAPEVAAFAGQLMARLAWKREDEPWKLS